MPSVSEKGQKKVKENTTYGTLNYVSRSNVIQRTSVGNKIRIIGFHVAKNSKLRILMVGNSINFHRQKKSQFHSKHLPIHKTEGVKWNSMNLRKEIFKRRKQ